MSDKQQELKTWRLSAIALTLLAIAVFLVQSITGPLFDTTLQIFIFYVPAGASIILFLYFRSKLK